MIQGVGQKQTAISQSRRPIDISILAGSLNKEPETEIRCGDGWKFAALEEFWDFEQKNRNIGGSW
jgi:hypothetical protein